MQTIDWDLAVATGVRLARPGPQVSLADARQAVRELRELSVTAQRHVREFTRMESLEEAGSAEIVDRPGWIRANVEGFRVVLEPLLKRMQGNRGDSAPNALTSFAASVGSRVTGVQLGGVLAYLSGRVLGQYELFLPPDPDGKAPTGRLTLVAPNIVMVERDLKVDPHDFRLWVCLHEETHRTQFTAVPWLRPYVQEQMGEFILASDLDPAAFMDRLRDITDTVADAVRGEGDSGSNLITAIQSPAQREILDRLTAVMSLVEGHGDYVMDAVGPGVVPTVATIRARFQQRRQATTRFDRAIRQLLGVDLKMKQYAEGAAFVRHVVAAAGMDGFNQVWSSPATLPSREEIQQPHRWVARVIGPAGELPAANA
ncbi:zinc-dependent metalloprotease [Allonocardiopsis opalescens]|uniref:Putative hydrolase/coenzyme F420 biosynthesis associated uncharacterized protein n=1 Tax=Allonocardiopsis opalescens TaxID=1144618 RepID=A0A2T0Q232_9ACTN|nr:zinc-dependent metalloprotease [Allonocardiopsis opalescens]PRX97853.1 putative hydrolase/coenzyme F420 biosynthesis associated uncharacterized protein [Allonocardiopsis opalescens]